LRTGASAAASGGRRWTAVASTRKPRQNGRGPNLGGCSDLSSDDSVRCPAPSAFQRHMMLLPDESRSRGSRRQGVDCEGRDRRTPEHSGFAGPGISRFVARHRRGLTLPKHASRATLRLVELYIRFDQTTCLEIRRLRRRAIGTSDSGGAGEGNVAC